MALIDGPVYQEAKDKAVREKLPYYVNAWGTGSTEYLSVNGFYGDRCVAIARETGEIELQVQNRFAEVARVGK